jgi:glycosyltransferase involved in cell wall biosynthesis
MKILQLWAPYRERGGEEHVVNLITNTLGKNNDVETCVFNFEDNNYHLLNPLVTLFSFYYNKYSINVLEETVNRFLPDIVISHNIMPAGSYGVYKWLYKRGIPVVYYVHNFRPYSVNGYCWANSSIDIWGLQLNFSKEIFYGSWQNSIARTAWYAFAIWYSHLTGVWQGIDRWIMISDFVSNMMITAGVSKQRAITLRHPWIKSYDYKLDTPISAVPTLLFMGRISEEKGIKALIQAWEIFESNDIAGELIIAGVGPLSSWLDSQCRILKRVHYVGYADFDMKSKLLQKTSAMVVPSIWWEPLGLVVYEAYEHGRPVLAARSGGLTETVEHGVTGWIHTPNDIQGLANNIIEALSQPDEAMRRGLNGYKWLKENANSDDWLKNIENILLDSIKSKACSNTELKNDRIRPLSIVTYLADQNPGYDRSFGISRMTESVLESLEKHTDVLMNVVISKTSFKGPSSSRCQLTIPIKTRSKLSRLIADNMHSLLQCKQHDADVWYYPKGFLPLLNVSNRITVITIHDTIIQYYRDNYPNWRKNTEYYYWVMMLKHSIKSANCILTVSNSSKVQIENFVSRFSIDYKKIYVTYQPCLYEYLPQPLSPDKKNYVIHLSSVEPHKRTINLVNWWHTNNRKYNLPILMVVGYLPEGVSHQVKCSPYITLRSFIPDSDLQCAIGQAKALVLPSEVEGFGLPAIEAYYLGTPVCHVVNTSVEEILQVATSKGRFCLENFDSLRLALEEVLVMSQEEIYNCGLRLREAYSSETVASKMMIAFNDVVSVMHN